MFSWLIPRNNPYWNQNLAKARGLELREALLEIVKPTEADWAMLTVLGVRAQPAQNHKSKD